MTTSASESGLFSSQTTRFSVPPFAGPTMGTASAVLAPVMRWDIGPFVPAPWRVTMSARLVATPPLPAAVIVPVMPTPVRPVAQTLTPVMPVAPIATPNESVPALFSHVTDEHPLPSIREFLTEAAPVVSTGADAVASPEQAVAADASGDLPWIDQFLANTPVAPMEAIAGPPDVYRYSTPMSSPAIEPVIEPVIENAIASAVETSSEPTVAVPSEAEVAAADAADKPVSALVDRSERVAPEPAVDAAVEAFAPPTPLYTTPVSYTPVASQTPLQVEAVPPYVPPVVDDVVAVVLEPVTDAPVSSEPVTNEPVVDEGAPVEPVVEAVLESVREPATDAPDEWPLDETASALDELTRDMTDGSADAVNSPSRLFGDVVEQAPLPAWGDDDLLNIMPTRATTPGSGTPLHLTPVQALFAVEAEPEQAAADASAIAAAQALEVLAQRVRNGELQLPGYDPRMGDAAALVSALAALLGIRLG